LSNGLQPAIIDPMSLPTDIRPVAVDLFFLPIRTRVPLKFGTETLTAVTCARAAVHVRSRDGRHAVGWGETPLSVQWVWPSATPYEPRHAALKEFCVELARAWSSFDAWGHPVELGDDFQTQVLQERLRLRNRAVSADPMPWLAALVACSPFDLALHDAFGQLLGRPTYQTYSAEFFSRDLSVYLEPERGRATTFAGLFPQDFLEHRPRRRLRAWHLVGGLDPLEPGDLNGTEPKDGHPLLLADWIRRDGLACLKVKLRGTDAAWDYERLTRIGRIAAAHGGDWLSADFNCTVTDPEYVNAILDRLRDEQPRLYGMLLYVEQPFPYDLERHAIDAHAVSARKPLFLDESAHDWRHVRLGRKLGWNGVALKTCKTQTGALLSACWARAHGMSLMVQDLTNPMLAQIPHVLLAAHTGTIMGVETNAMQFYPAASEPEARVHPGLYERRDGHIDLGSLAGPGFGYRLDEIARDLPAPAVRAGAG
jgi:L-alanine-DL-glutamate epimerase-like enolase superfamily enzyme